MRVRDVYEWEEEDSTGPYNCCSHGKLVKPRPETLPPESDVYQAFRNIVLTRSFQKDLAKASPYGGTSICETKHALDRLYCRKEIFYPLSTYHVYAKLATTHINTLRLAEMAGERNVLRVLQIQRKYNRRKSTIVSKFHVPYKWRDDVLAEVFSARVRILDAHEDCLDSDQLPDEFSEVMMAEEAFESDYGVEL
ncbi:hypothetical protein Y032_0170g248 [Ancylostoma ceylanicum]|nr:hypothetical protein Y032_0170g248 [Ancylostoma ceylanicum]